MQKKFNKERLQQAKAILNEKEMVERIKLFNQFRSRVKPLPDLFTIRKQQKELTLEKFLALPNDSTLYIDSSHCFDFAQSLFKQGYIFAEKEKSLFYDDKEQEDNAYLAYLWLFEKILQDKKFVSESNPSNLDKLQSLSHFPFWGHIVCPKAIGEGSFSYAKQESRNPLINLYHFLEEQAKDEMLSKFPTAQITFTLAIPKSQLIALRGEIWDFILLYGAVSENLWNEIEKRERQEKTVYLSRKDMPHDLQTKIEQEHLSVFLNNPLPTGIESDFSDDIQGVFLNFNINMIVDLRLTFH